MAKGTLQLEAPITHLSPQEPSRRTEISGQETIQSPGKRARMMGIEFSLHDSNHTEPNDSGVWGLTSKCYLPRPDKGILRNIWAREDDTCSPAEYWDQSLGPGQHLRKKWKPGAQRFSQQPRPAEVVPGSPCLPQNSACGRGTAAKLTVTLQESAGES